MLLVRSTGAEDSAAAEVDGCARCSDGGPCRSDGAETLGVATEEWRDGTKDVWRF
jgi:hypothetical protein